MAQHFLLEPVAAGARQFRVGQQSQDTRYELRSSRLVLAGIVGVVAMALLFMWGTVTAVQTIDSRSIAAERDRASAVRAVRVLAHVIEQEFAESVERDAFHEARRNDAIGVDIVAGHVHRTTGHLGDFFESHFEGNF